MAVGDGCVACGVGLRSANKEREGCIRGTEEANGGGHGGVAKEDGGEGERAG